MEKAHQVSEITSQLNVGLSDIVFCLFNLYQNGCKTEVHRSDREYASFP